MSLYEKTRSRLFGAHNPYAGFPAKDWAGTWYNDPNACVPIFREAIDRACPGVVVEVGSFVGESTIFMGEYLKRSGREAVIVAVDTWGGGTDHWIKVPEKLRFWFGRPSLFYQFMGNVMARGVQDVVLPLSVDSMTGARILKFMGIVPNMVYVDGSHEEGDVIRDYEAYWELLPKGGVMLVDDVSDFFPGVQRDFAYFCGLYCLTPTMRGEKGMLVKP